MVRTGPEVSGQASSALQPANVDTNVEIKHDGRAGQTTGKSLADYDEGGLLAELARRQTLQRNAKTASNKEAVRLSKHESDSVGGKHRDVYDTEDANLEVELQEANKFCTAGACKKP